MVRRRSSGPALVELDARRGGAAGRAERPDRARRAGAGGAGQPRRSRPGIAELGVMLPYTPLHHLLLADGRRPAGDDQRQPHRRADRAPRRGRPRAPGGDRRRVLLHDRPIHTRVDDSVVRAVPGAGRCCAPLARVRARRAWPCRCPPRGRCWPCGAELKSTVCVAKGRRAWVGHHIGDLEDWRDAARRSASRSSTSSASSRSRPEVVAHDLHPGYLSTRLRPASARGSSARACSTTTPTSPPAWPSTGEHGPGRRRDPRRHRLRHRRHDLGRRDPGRGPRGLERAAHLRPVRDARRRGRRSASPGGWPAPGSQRRAGARAGDPRRHRRPRRPRDLERGGAGRRARSARRSPPARAACSTPSSAICGLRARVTYEGQAAIELEAACDPAAHGGYLDGRPRPPRGGPRRGP